MGIHFLKQAERNYTASGQIELQAYLELLAKMELFTFFTPVSCESSGAQAPAWFCTGAIIHALWEAGS